RPVAVPNPLDVALRRRAKAHRALCVESIPLAGLARIDARTVLRLVAVQHRVPAIVAGLFQEPGKDAARILRIGDAGVGAAAVDVVHVVRRRGLPVHVAGRAVGPALDASKESFGARSVAPYP